jgi:hypothetical protein
MHTLTLQHLHCTDTTYNLLLLLSTAGYAAAAGAKAGSRGAASKASASKPPSTPLQLAAMALWEGPGGGSLSFSAFEPEFVRPAPPQLPVPGVWCSDNYCLQQSC